MTRYYIFKTDNNTNKTVHICNGSYDTIGECRRHWLAYAYGFMDCAFEVYGAGNFEMSGDMMKDHKFTFRAKAKNVSYFMLFDKEGQELIKKIS
jgi:hypothetical protein